MTAFDLKIHIRLALISLGHDPKRPFPKKMTISNLKQELTSLRREQVARGIIPFTVERA
jgi:hypothetical protein